jgi:hypothetical protein
VGRERTRPVYVYTKQKEEEEEKENTKKSAILTKETNLYYIAPPIHPLLNRRTIHSPVAPFIFLRR